MKQITFIKIILILFFISVCYFCNSHLLFRKNEINRRLCSQIGGLQVDAVRELLAQGANPNYCIGELGWFDSNPIMKISPYSTLQESKIKNPPPDSEILNLLISAGADINARPCIWWEVYANNNETILLIKRIYNYQGELDENPMYRKNVDTLIGDVNRYIEALLKAGANPDALGHPYPFSDMATTLRITDAQAKRYF
jgi:hypothetical protein